MTDLLFMGEVVRGARAEKERLERVERQLRTCREEVKRLGGELQREREKSRDLEGQRDRLEQEGVRGTCERMAFEWRGKYEGEVRRHERCRDLLDEMKEECKRAKREKQGFVQDLQRKMECAGVKMWYVEEGDRGMFVRDDVYKEQLICREREVEKGQRELLKKAEELQNQSKKLEAVLGDLREKKRLVGQLEGYGESLRGTLRVMNQREKAIGRELERAVKKGEKVNIDAQLALDRVEREKSSAATSRIRALRGDVERFRISAKRDRERRLKLQSRSFEKVGFFFFPVTYFLTHTYPLILFCSILEANGRLIFCIMLSTLRNVWSRLRTKLVQQKPSTRKKLRFKLMSPAVLWMPWIYGRFGAKNARHIPKMPSNTAWSSCITVRNVRRIACRSGPVY